MEANNLDILNESIKNLEASEFNSRIIQDNKIIFIYEDKSYRVRMPNQGEQVLADHKRNLMQLEYLNQEGCITRSQLVEKLKTSGILDMDKVEHDREILTTELKKLWYALATKSSESKSSIIEYSEKITAIQNELKKMAIETATYLIPCLESRLEKFTVEYLTFLCTDVQKDDGWVRAWNSYDEYLMVDTPLIDKASANLTWMLLNRRS